MAKLTKETSPFQAGVVVAVIRSRAYADKRSIRRGVVAKVHANGRFFLEGNLDDGLTPREGWNSTPVGKWKDKDNEFVQLWNEEIEEEIASNKSYEETVRKLAYVKSAVGGLYPAQDKEKIELLHHIAKFLNEEGSKEAMAAIIAAIPGAN